MTIVFRKQENGKANTPFQEQKQALYRYWERSRLITEKSVLEAFLAVPRELFVQPSLLDQTYADHPLPIGAGQTISQPTTVMLMLQLLEVKRGNSILEIGAGSGYNAALLEHLGGRVVTVERHEKLAELARENLSKAGLKRVQVFAADGKKGYRELAPYDRIIVTAASSKLPQHLKEQLAIGGILVAPVGATHGCEMLRIEKTTEEQFETSSNGLFSFVPLV